MLDTRKLVALRARAGLSQREAAAELARLGVAVTAAQVCHVERGRRGCSAETIIALAVLYGVEPVDLLAPALRRKLARYLNAA